ncbi:MAG TPA: hypothetical protein VNW26_03720 [Steroidobacteraceae bacterium]|nr:hypothetical protein [Steroidobacteraceae bacterium]
MSTSMHRNVGALCLCAVLAAALPAVAVGEESSADAIKTLQQKLDQSLKMIEALAARVKELETKQAATPPGGAAPPPAAVAQAERAASDSARLQAVEQQVSQIETANAARQGDDTGLPVHGFADVNIGNHNPFHPYEKGASLNNLDLYLTPKLGDKWLSLFELNFEVDHDGNVGVDIERGQLGYQFSDAATVWVGRFHTPYGYVNTAFHHGVWLNDSLRRPAFLMFEDQGGVMPSHTVGAWLTGAMRGEDGKVLYDVFAGNGQQIIGGQIDMRSGGNDHGKLIYGGRLGYQWIAGPAEGLLVGVDAFDSKVDDDQIPENLTEVRVAGAYAVYDTDTWEVLSEAYLFDNVDLYQGMGTHRSNAYFAQVGYRFPTFIPYVRYERAHLDQTDQYFAQQMTGGSYYRTAAGFRHDLNQKVAVKFEVANTHYTDRIIGDFNEFLSQLAIRF